MLPNPQFPVDFVIFTEEIFRFLFIIYFRRYGVLSYFLVDVNRSLYI